MVRVRRLVHVIFCLILYPRISNALASTAPSKQRPRSRPRSEKTGSNSINVNNNNYNEGQRVPLKIGSALRRHAGVILVDVENVRGKSGFGLSHNDLLQSLSEWTKACQLVGQVVMMVDHGTSADAYWVPVQEDCSAAIAVVFAGPVLKADDVLARDIGKIARWTNEWANNGREEEEISDHQEKAKDDNKEKIAPVMVVTDDQGLLSRCRKSTAKKHLQVVSPLSLLEELEQLKNADTVIEYESTCVRAALEEIIVGAEWLQAQSKVQATLKKHIPNKRRKALRQKATDLQHKLEQTDMGRDIFKYASTLMAACRTEDSNDVIELLPSAMSQMATKNELLHPEIQSALMNEWERLRTDIRHRTYQKEKTNDRVVLAEHFRQELEQNHGQHTRVLCNRSNQRFHPAQTYVRDWIWTHHTLTQNDQHNNPHPTSTLTIVAISDTHGYESQLGTLPSGDVLLHLGDFALEGPAKASSLKTFDQWLAQQPHPYKIVLRGNHDPHRVDFELSGASYVTSPKTVLMAGYSLALVPHVSRLTTRCLPNRCDMVASHVPPKGVLDECLTGKSAGSNTLRRRLQQMTKHSNGSGPPLVLCGHIHESRGLIRHNFADPSTNADSEQATLVVNVANANSGIAKEIKHGPVVIELSKEEEEEDSETTASVTFRSAETGIDGGYRSRRSPESESNHCESSCVKLLLVIRLGLRSGMSLFNSQGKLVRHQQLQFKSIEDLENRALSIMSNWETDIADDTLSSSPKQAFSYIVLEGGDPSTRKPWMEAAASVIASPHPKDLIFLEANEWRKDMLTEKERTDPHSSRAAARDIAKQVLADYGSINLAEPGKLPVDKSQKQSLQASI